MKRHPRLLAPAALFVLATVLAPTPALAQAADTIPAPPPAGNAPGPDAPTGGNEQDLRLFGQAFQLSAVGIEIQLEGNEVSQLDARQDVVLVMDQFTITATRITYDGTSKMMRGFGSEEQRCVIVQKEATSLCDEFAYNMETRETKFFGRPVIEFQDKENPEKNLMKADSISIEQTEPGPAQKTIIRLRSRAMLGTKDMIDRQIDNPKAAMPLVQLGGGSRQPEPPPLVIDDLITTSPIRITPANGADVTDATMRDPNAVAELKGVGKARADQQLAPPRKPDPDPTPIVRPNDAPKNR